MVVLAYGVSMTVSTPWGVSAWDVLHLGVTGHTPLSLGQAGQLTGLLVIGIAWMVRRRYVTIISIVNALLVGGFVDLFLKYELVPFVDGLWGLLYLELGVIIFAAGMALYLAPGLGAGPRDALMMSLSDAFGVQVGPIRIVLDLLAIGLGALLGGPVGIGTLIAAITLGPWVQVFIRPAAHLNEHNSRFFLRLFETTTVKSARSQSSPSARKDSDSTAPPTFRKPRPK